MALFDLSKKFEEQATIGQLHLEDAASIDVNGDSFADTDMDDSDLPPMTVGPNGEMQPFEDPDDMFSLIHNFWSESVKAAEQKKRLSRRIMNKALAADINASLPGLFNENHSRDEYTETNSTVGFEYVNKHVDECQRVAIENLTGRFNEMMTSFIPGVLADIELLKEVGIGAVVQNTNLDPERVKKAKLLKPLVIEGRPVQPLAVFGSMWQPVVALMEGKVDEQFVSQFKSFSNHVTAVEDGGNKNYFAAIMCSDVRWPQLQQGWPEVCVDITANQVMDCWVSGEFETVLNQTWEYMLSAEKAMSDYMEKYKTLSDDRESMALLYELVCAHQKSITLAFHSTNMVKMATVMVQQLDGLIPAIEAIQQLDPSMDQAKVAGGEVIAE